MHGIEHRVSERRTSWPLCSPASAFFPLTGSSLPGPPQPFASLLYGTHRSNRLFARLQRLPLSRPPFQGRCSWPDPSLLRSVASKPVRLSAPQPLSGFDPVTAASPLQPVALRLPRSGGSSLSLHSPSGLLPPSGSKRSADFRPPGPPSGSARFPLAPRSRGLLLVSGNGSKFRIRYVTGGLLFLKPLGTFPTMRPL